MEPIEVTVRFDIQGQAYPQQFAWNGRIFSVTSTGRRWKDEAGQHILVMTAEALAIELVFDVLKIRWYLNPTGASPKIALST
jgi:hypothetical protein